MVDRRGISLFFWVLREDRLIHVSGAAKYGPFDLFGDIVSRAIQEDHSSKHLGLQPYFGEILGIDRDQGGQMSPGAMPHQENLAGRSTEFGRVLM